jgi:hypothetical protein
MQIAEEKHGESWSSAPSGRVDSASSAELEGALLRHLGAGKTPPSDDLTALALRFRGSR